MKWLVGLFVIWIILRGRFDAYAALTSDVSKSEIKETGALDRLEGLMKVFE